MADILIRGMEMPKPGQSIFVAENYNGSIYVRLEQSEKWCLLIPLPEGHGRLGDLDALLNESYDVVEDHSGLDYIDPCPIWGYSANMIAHAPTIVPAEGEDE